jgi:hypothetical protein
MQVQGKVKVILAEETVGASNFRKRSLIVTTEDQYPQTINIEFVQDKCDLLNDVVVGQDVNVSINLRGREWINPQGEAKYFNQIQGWRIEAGEVAQGQDQGSSNESDPDPIKGEDEDDLPF